MTDISELTKRAEQAETALEKAMRVIRWAHDTLSEVNIWNYDHDDVVALNSASVEVIGGLGQALHGEWHPSQEKEIDLLNRQLDAMVAWAAHIGDEPDLLLTAWRAAEERAEQIEDYAARLTEFVGGETVAIAIVKGEIAPPSVAARSLPTAFLHTKHRFGDRVTKIRGSSWTGLVCGFYSTALTPIGYAVESENEPGSVQVYPEAALSIATRAAAAIEGAAS